MNQVINKISNILNSIKKMYSPSKIEEHLIKKIEKVDKETDAETLIQEDKRNGSVEIPDIPESEDLRIGPQLEEQLTKLLREAEEITERANISTEINLSQSFL